jgi:hypothetical protein
MARLERDKVMVGYRAVIGERQGGGKGNSLGAVLSIAFSERHCFTVVEKFRHWPEIIGYCSVTGRSPTTW